MSTPPLPKPVVIDLTGSSDDEANLPHQKEIYFEHVLAIDPGIVNFGFIYAQVYADGRIAILRMQVLEAGWSWDLAKGIL